MRQKARPAAAGEAEMGPIDRRRRRRGCAQTSAAGPLHRFRLDKPFSIDGKGAKSPRKSLVFPCFFALSPLPSRPVIWQGGRPGSGGFVAQASRTLLRGLPANRQGRARENRGPAHYGLTPSRSGNGLWWRRFVILPPPVGEGDCTLSAASRFSDRIAAQRFGDERPTCPRHSADTGMASAGGDGDFAVSCRPVLPRMRPRNWDNPSNSE